MALSASRYRKNLFRNIKYEIILEVFKSNHLQAYEKEYWRLEEYWILQKKSVMVKAVISSTISKEAVGRVLQKTDLKWTHFHRKEILTKNDLKLRLKFARKVCRKRVMCNYVIWNHQNVYVTRESRS